MDYKGKYIGEKQVVDCVKTEENTPGGFPIWEVTYEENKEWFSETMLKNIVSDEPCDLNELREKRVQPVVEMCLAVIRDYGLKVSELPHMSIMLNTSLDHNQKEAEIELWSKFMPRPLAVDEIDYLTIDRVLRTIENEPKDKDTTGVSE